MSSTQVYLLLFLCINFIIFLNILGCILCISELVKIHESPTTRNSNQYIVIYSCINQYYVWSFSSYFIYFIVLYYFIPLCNMLFRCAKTFCSTSLFFLVFCDVFYVFQNWLKYLNLAVLETQIPILPSTYYCNIQLHKPILC